MLRCHLFQHSGCQKNEAYQVIYFFHQVISTIGEQQVIDTYPTVKKTPGTASFVGELVSRLQCHDE